MDVEIEKVEGLPPGCLLSISAGGSRRQAPLVPRQRLTFSGQSASAALANGGSGLKVDVLTVQGSARIPLSELGPNFSVNDDGTPSSQPTDTRIQVPIQMQTRNESDAAQRSVTFSEPTEPGAQSSSVVPMSVALNIRSSPSTGLESSRLPGGSLLSAADGTPLSMTGLPTPQPTQQSTTRKASSGRHHRGGSSSRSSRHRHHAALEARSYLEDHNILPFVERMLRTLVKDRPHDPWKAIGEMLPEGDIEALLRSSPNKPELYDLGDLSSFRRPYQFQPSVGTWLSAKRELSRSFDRSGKAGTGVADAIESPELPSLREKVGSQELGDSETSKAARETRPGSMVEVFDGPFDAVVELQAEDDECLHKPFELKPSVGTWQLRLRHDQKYASKGRQEMAGELLASAEEFNELPYYQRPSVGTWRYSLRQEQRLAARDTQEISPLVETLEGEIAETRYDLRPSVGSWQQLLREDQKSAAIREKEANDDGLQGFAREVISRTLKEVQAARTPTVGSCDNSIIEETSLEVCEVGELERTRYELRPSVGTWQMSLREEQKVAAKQLEDTWVEFEDVGKADLESVAIINFKATNLEFPKVMTTRDIAQLLIKQVSEAISSCVHVPASCIDVDLSQGSVIFESVVHCQQGDASQLVKKHIESDANSFLQMVEDLGLKIPGIQETMKTDDFTLGLEGLGVRIDKLKRSPLDIANVTTSTAYPESAMSSVGFSTASSFRKSGFERTYHPTALEESISEEGTQLFDVTLTPGASMTSPFHLQPSSATWLQQRLPQKGSTLAATVEEQEVIPVEQSLTPPTPPEPSPRTVADNSAVASYFLQSCVPRLEFDDLSEAGTSPMMSGVGPLGPSRPSSAYIRQTVPEEFVITEPLLAMVDVPPSSGTAVVDPIELKDLASKRAASVPGTWVSEQSEAALAEHAAVCKASFRIENLDFDKVEQNNEVHNGLRQAMVVGHSRYLKVRPHSVAVHLEKDSVGSVIVNASMFCHDMTVASAIKSKIDGDVDTYTDEMCVYAAQVQGIGACQKAKSVNDTPDATLKPGGMVINQLSTTCDEVSVASFAQKFVQDVVDSTQKAHFRDSNTFFTESSQDKPDVVEEIIAVSLEKAQGDLQLRPESAGSSSTFRNIAGGVVDRTMPLVKGNITPSDSSLFDAAEPVTVPPDTASVRQPKVAYLEDNGDGTYNVQYKGIQATALSPQVVFGQEPSWDGESLAREMVRRNLDEAKSDITQSSAVFDASEPALSEVRIDDQLTARDDQLTARQSVVSDLDFDVGAMVRGTMKEVVSDISNSEENADFGSCVSEASPEKGVVSNISLGVVGKFGDTTERSDVSVCSSGVPQSFISGTVNQALILDQADGGSAIKLTSRSEGASERKKERRSEDRAGIPDALQQAARRYADESAVRQESITSLEKQLEEAQKEQKGEVCEALQAQIDVLRDEQKTADAREDEILKAAQAQADRHYSDESAARQESISSLEKQLEEAQKEQKEEVCEALQAQIDVLREEQKTADARKDEIQQIVSSAPIPRVPLDRSVVEPEPEIQSTCSTSRNSFASRIVRSTVMHAEADANSLISHVDRASAISAGTGAVLDPLFPMIGGNEVRPLTSRSNGSSGIHGSFASGIVKTALSEAEASVPSSQCAVQRDSRPSSRPTSGHNRSRPTSAFRQQRNSSKSAQDIPRPTSATARPESIASSLAPHEEVDAMMSGLMSHAEARETVKGVKLLESSVAADSLGSYADKLVNDSIDRAEVDVTDSERGIDRQSMVSHDGKGLDELGLAAKVARDAIFQAEKDTSDSGADWERNSKVSDASMSYLTLAYPQFEDAVVLTCSFQYAGLHFDKIANVSGQFDKLRQKIQEGIALKTYVPVNSVDIEFSKGLSVTATIFCDTKGMADKLRTDWEGNSEDFVEMLNKQASSVPGIDTFPDAERVILNVQHVKVPKGSKTTSAPAVATQASDIDSDNNFMVDVLPNFLLAGRMPSIDGQNSAKSSARDKPYSPTPAMLGLPKVRYSTSALPITMQESPQARNVSAVVQQESSAVLGEQAKQLATKALSEEPEAEPVSPQNENAAVDVTSSVSQENASVQRSATRMAQEKNIALATSTSPAEQSLPQVETASSVGRSLPAEVEMAPESVEQSGALEKNIAPMEQSLPQEVQVAQRVAAQTSTLEQSAVSVEQSIPPQVEVAPKGVGQAAELEKSASPLEKSLPPDTEIAQSVAAQTSTLEQSAVSVEQSIPPQVEVAPKGVGQAAELEKSASPLEKSLPPEVGSPPKLGEQSNTLEKKASPVEQSQVPELETERAEAARARLIARNPCWNVSDSPPETKASAPQHSTGGVLESDAPAVAFQEAASQKPVVSTLDFSRMSPNRSMHEISTTMDASGPAVETSTLLDSSNNAEAPSSYPSLDNTFQSYQSKDPASPEKQWVVRPSSPVFLKLKPLEVKTSWVQRPSVGTWSITRPTSALLTPKDSQIRLMFAAQPNQVAAKSEDTASSIVAEDGIKPRRPEIEIANDPSTRPDQPWLMRPSTGTWLKHSPVNTTKPITEPWELRDNEGKWVAPEGLDATPDRLGSIREERNEGLVETTKTIETSEMMGREVEEFTDVDQECRPEAPLPAKLLRLKGDATKLDTACREATDANDKLRKENDSLRLEIHRLMALSSPSDTPLWSARA